MGLLDGDLREVFGSVFAPLLLDCEIVQISMTPDGEGGMQETRQIASAKGMVESYSAYERLRAGIPSTDVKLILLQKDVSLRPDLDTEIRIRGETYSVQGIEEDPAQASWTLQGRLIRNAARESVIDPVIAPLRAMAGIFRPIRVSAVRAGLRAAAGVMAGLVARDDVIAPMGARAGFRLPVRRASIAAPLRISAQVNAAAGMISGLRAPLEARAGMGSAAAISGIRASLLAETGLGRVSRMIVPHGLAAAGGVGTARLQAQLSAPLRIEGGFDLPEIVPAGPVFDEFTTHAWDPASGADETGAVQPAVGPAPLWAMNSQGVIADWAGTLISGQALILDAEYAGPAIEGGPKALSFWRRVEAGGATFRAIVSHANAPTSSQDALPGSWRLSGWEEPDLEYAYRTDLNFQAGLVANGVIIPDAWEFFVLNFNSGAWECYVNGVRVITLDEWPATTGSIGRALAFGAAQVGAAINHETPFAIQNGVVQDFGDIRIHDRPLTETEVGALYQAGRRTY